MYFGWLFDGIGFVSLIFSILGKAAWGPWAQAPPRMEKLRETKPMPSNSNPKINCILSKQNFCLVLAGPHLLHILIDNDKRNMAICKLNVVSSTAPAVPRPRAALKIGVASPSLENFWMFRTLWASSNVFWCFQPLLGVFGRPDCARKNANASS